MARFFITIIAFAVIVLGGGMLYQSGCGSVECVVQKFSPPQEVVVPSASSTQTTQNTTREVAKKETATPIPTTTQAAPEKKVSAPGPLKVIHDTILGESQSELTKTGVINQTNNERTAQGLSTLSENSKLDASAEAKVDDMFAKQYFEHVSPSGVGVDKLAENVGYAYIVVGENLALGNFKDDKALVTAWMNSPGHRANILNIRFEEIGVSVKKGMFDGREVWLGVQEFGKPPSSCPSIDPFLKQSIENNKQQTESLQISLNTLRQEIDSMQPKYGDVYNQKVDEYNSLIPSYNQLVEATRALVDNYNTQVRIFNECIAK
ncbi:MAG: CAP domain-containing protein [Candidatus Yonathbacteria bacterium]|nr:CAP domain-containing protein [Candidatus Yonathbacteria bacterium]